MKKEIYSFTKNSLLLSFLFTVSVNCNLFAQNNNNENQQSKNEFYAKPSEKITVPLFQSIDVRNKHGTDFFSHMISQEVIHESPDGLKIEKIKQEKAKLKYASSSEFKNNSPDSTETFNPLVITPQVGINYAGNQYNGLTPPDNTMAISDGGIVVSAVNSNIEFDTTTAPGGSSYYHSIYYFLNDSTLQYSILYDPRVIYDAGQDRFIVVVLYGTQSAISTIIACFSKTNNPADGFWTYKIPGNIISGCWFDYPSIATSNNELFISGNEYYNAGIFNQAVVLQIDKMACYAGSPLNFIWWGSIQTGNLTYAFSVKPVPFGGHGNYGPGIYLVSHDNSVYSEVELHHITDDMNNVPQFITYTPLSQPWSPAPDAQQLGTNILLSNGDNRILSAFYLDSIVHFVFHADHGGGYNGIVYNRLNVYTQNITTTTYGLNGFDYSYPSVAHFGTSNFDRSVLICFLRSGPTIYPEVRVGSCDNSLLWSNSTLIHSGIHNVKIFGGAVERWGDYSGICFKKNLVMPEVWVAGCYGAADSTWHTWIAQVGDITVGLDNTPKNDNSDISVYPNPASDFFSIRFTIPKPQTIRVQLNDATGKTARILYDSWTPGGENIYTFNKKALPSGVYVITITSGNKTLASEKLIVSN